MRTYFYSAVMASFLIAMFCNRIEASCCSSSGSFGVGKLLLHERGLIELSTNTRYIFGSFDRTSRFSAGSPPHLAHVIIEPEIQIMARLVPHVEAFVRLPERIQISSVRSGSGLSDISLGAHFPLFKEHAFTYAPSLSLFSAIKIPTGAAVDASEENITSNGIYEFMVGFLLEKEWLGINYGLAYGFSAEKDYFTTSSQKPGAKHMPSLSAAYSLNDKEDLSASFSLLLRTANKIGSQVLKDTDQRKLTMAFGYAIKIHSHIKLSLQLGSDIPIIGTGKRINSESFLRLAMRFGVY